MQIYGLIDIDDFTYFNFENSFEAGDKVLNEIGRIVNKVLKPVYWDRLDSDEYIFKINGQFEDRKETIVAFMGSVKSNLGITVSIGLSEMEYETDFREVIFLLRQNLCIAKEHGKNKFCYQ